MSIWQGLSSNELDFTEDAARALKSVGWAAPLLDHARQRGHLPSQVRDRGPQRHRKPSDYAFLSDFFEIRFAFALSAANATASYEYATGVGATSVDFRVEGNPPWLVELVCLQVTDAVRDATHVTASPDGVTSYSLHQSSDSPDERDTPGYEVYKAQSKIAEKVFSSGQPVKFPVPSDHRHMVVADMRGYNAGDGCDEYDLLQIAVGPQRLAGMKIWQATSPQRQSLRGLFEEQCPLQGADTARERLHFLTFVREGCYVPGELRGRSYHVNNPHLLGDTQHIRDAITSWPLCGRYRPISMAD